MSLGSGRLLYRACAPVVFWCGTRGTRTGDGGRVALPSPLLGPLSLSLPRLWHLARQWWPCLVSHVPEETSLVLPFCHRYHVLLCTAIPFSPSWTLAVSCRRYPVTWSPSPDGFACGFERAYVRRIRLEGLLGLLSSTGRANWWRLPEGRQWFYVEATASGTASRLFMA